MLASRSASEPGNVVGFTISHSTPSSASADRMRRLSMQAAKWYKWHNTHRCREKHNE